MALVTYLIRVLPLTLIRKEIKNQTLKSFLYYVPYVTLAVMTFPAILDSTQSTLSAIIALITAVALAWWGRSLFQVAVISCVVVFVVEFAEKIDKVLPRNSNITFIIGGSLGLNDEVRSLCDELISFSKMTFPHGLFRGILLEQIYRACKINNHEMYHK